VNGIHDMGGMHGFGRVPIEVNEPVFHEEWEGRVWAINLCTRMPAGLRPEIEVIPPASYLRYSYYEKWLHAKVEGLIKAGLIDRDELAQREVAIAADPAAVANPIIEPARVTERLERLHTFNSPDTEPTGEPQFRAGNEVRVRNINPPGHTRMPRYTRGHIGIVQQLWGWHRIEDQDPPGVMTERAEPVYSVRFEGAELWGDQAEPNQAVYIDMWESYLESPETTGPNSESNGSSKS
jgi:nitrile hydratase beta subunit